jgi:5-methyltetrahydrofolate--homocysteine methyltransferase
MALCSGLSAAIMNPYSTEVMSAYHSYLALGGYDVGCKRYMEAFSRQQASDPTPDSTVTDLKVAIIKGMKNAAGDICRRMLDNTAPLDVVEGYIIPALDTVGEGYEKNTLYLPSLLMSAEAAGCAFEAIKRAYGKEMTAVKCRAVIATVKGDVHDIGKNIVKLVLENYGYEVIDLGKDVACDTILQTVIETKAPLLFLSALMTTTAPAMAEVIRAVKESMPSCKITVGGAVITAEYAASVGADFYAKDAMEAVRFAEEVYEASLR